MSLMLTNLDQAVSRLNDLNFKIGVWRDDWVNFTAAQKNGLKTRCNTEIDAVIALLGTVKTEITNIPN